jgi:hypothetical protein
MGNVFQAGITNNWQYGTDWIFIETKLDKIVGQFSSMAFSECILSWFNAIFTFSGRSCPIEFHQTTD